MKYKISIVGLVIAIIAVVVIILTGSKKDAVSNGSKNISREYGDTVKIGHLVALDMAPLFVAKEAGYFSEEGVDVETVLFSNPGDQNAALAGGSIQLATSPFTLAYLGQNSGVPMRILSNAGGNGIMQVVIQGNYKIDSMDSLVSYIKANPTKKIKVGTLRGDTLDMILYRSFKEKGLDYDDFEMIWFDDLFAMVESFKTKDIDILSHIQPYTIDLQKNYGARLLTDNATVWGQGTPNVTLTSLDNFQKEYPETVKKVLRAEHKALNLIKQNPKKAVELLSGKNYYKVSDEVLLASFKTQQKATLIPNVSGMKIALDDMVAQNYITLPKEQVVDTSILNSLGLK